MESTEIKLETAEIKLYLRIDNDDEDTLLEMFKCEAEEYLTAAGISKNYSKFKYKLAVLLLISDSYEYRQIRSDSNKKEQNISDRIDRIILQLRMEELEETTI